MARPPDPRGHRRRAILRGKRAGAFDRDQYYLERAERARVARRMRIQLRRMAPVVLVTPRWSQPLRFLDDLAVDLLIGEPQVRARTLSLRPLEGRTPHQAWSWLVLAMTEFCQLPLEGPAWQVVSRRGFRHVMAELFARAEQGERRCLMIHGLEHIHVEALRDLIEVFSAHLREHRGERRFNLVLAGSIDAAYLEFEGCERLVLSDYGPYEAVEALAELLGAKEQALLAEAVGVVGGVPAILDGLGSGTMQRIADVVGDHSVVWRTLGALSVEMRRTFDLADSDKAQSDRMDAIARNGPQPPDEATDPALFRAGLIRRTGPAGNRTALRAPFFADLALL